MLIKEFCYHQKGCDDLSHKKHTHENTAEFIQILSGEGSFLINNSIYRMVSGAIYIIDSSCVHCSIPKDPGHYVRNKLIVDKQSLLNILALCGASFEGYRNQCFILNKEQSRQIESVFERIDMQEENQKSLCTVAGLMDILLISAMHKSETNANVSTVDKILIYINENPYNDMTVDSIADNLHISKYYLCHVFKEMTSMIVMEYIKLQRIQLAKDMLLYSADTVSQIAIKCGFENFSYFSRIFKEITSVSPTKYRKNN